MCGTVAWLMGKTFRDDEQFDLAAWFLSFLVYLAVSRVDTASFLYLSILRQRKLGRVLYSRGSNKIHLGYYFTANLHFVIRMHDELGNPVCVDETFTIVVKVHLKTVLWKTD